MTHGQTFDTTVWETLMKNLSSMITLAVIKNSGVEKPVATFWRKRQLFLQILGDDESGKGQKSQMVI